MKIRLASCTIYEATDRFSASNHTRLTFGEYALPLAARQFVREWEISNDPVFAFYFVIGH
jgi:hypothetical protein